MLRQDSEVSDKDAESSVLDPWSVLVLDYSVAKFSPFLASNDMGRLS